LIKNKLSIPRLGIKKTESLNVPQQPQLYWVNFEGSIETF
jgi:hypothetical protein